VLVMLQMFLYILLLHFMCLILVISAKKKLYLSKFWLNIRWRPSIVVVLWKYNMKVNILELEWHTVERISPPWPIVTIKQTRGNITSSAAEYGIPQPTVNLKCSGLPPKCTPWTKNTVQHLFIAVSLVSVDRF